MKNVLMKGDKDKHFGENLSPPREELTNEMPQKDTRGTRKIPTKPSVKYKITDKTHTPKNYKISEIDRDYSKLRSGRYLDCGYPTAAIGCGDRATANKVGNEEIG